MLSADEDLVKKAEETKLLSSVTAFESQLVRSFKKAGESRKASVDKYMLIYATVPPSQVLAVLFAEAQKVHKKSDRIRSRAWVACLAWWLAALCSVSHGPWGLS